MSNSSIEPLLLEIQNVVADIDRMNAGGCAVFAALVARRLNKIGVKAKVRVGDVFCWGQSKKQFKNAKKKGAKTLEDYRNNGIGFWHLVVEITEGKQKYHFDSESLVPAKENLVLFPQAEFYEGAISPAECLTLARSKDWNYMFDRKQIPALIKKLNEVFRRADQLIGNNG